LTTIKLAKLNGGGACPTINAPYDDQYYCYYTVYSLQYDTEFIITAKKQIFSATIYGCNTADEQITDNLEDAKNDKRYLEIINKQLAMYNYSLNKTYKRSYNEEDLIIEVKIEDDFNIQYYYELLEIKNKLIEEHRELLNEDKNVSIDTIKIIFNDRTFSSFLESIYMERDGEMDIEIEDPEFWKYVGE